MKKKKGPEDSEQLRWRARDWAGNLARFVF